MKRGKHAKPIEYTDELNIQFECQISYKDYRNLMFELTFKKPIYIILTIIIITFMFSGLFIFLRDDTTLNPTSIVIIAIWLFIFPFLILRQAKNTYKMNKIFHEQLNYTLNNNAVL